MSFVECGELGWSARAKVVASLNLRSSWRLYVWGEEERERKREREREREATQTPKNIYYINMTPHRFQMVSYTVHQL